LHSKQEHKKNGRRATGCTRIRKKNRRTTQRVIGGRGDRKQPTHPTKSGEKNGTNTGKKVTAQGARYWARLLTDGKRLGDLANFTLLIISARSRKKPGKDNERTLAIEGSSIQRRRVKRTCNSFNPIQTAIDVPDRKPGMPKVQEKEANADCRKRGRRRGDHKRG